MIQIGLRVQPMIQNDRQAQFMIQIGRLAQPINHFLQHKILYIRTCEE